MQRVHVVGPCGSGKTTLARALGERTRLPVTDLDDLHWLPHWTENPALPELLDEVLATDRWVISGNYYGQQPKIHRRADTLVWIDYGFPRTMWQLLRRTFRRALRGELCCNGNRESLWRAFFHRDSILLWLIQTHRSVRRRYTALAAETEMEVVHLRHPRATARWLESLAAE